MEEVEECPWKGNKGTNEGREKENGGNGDNSGLGNERTLLL